MSGELIIPTAAALDSEAVEMLRVWVAQKGLHCSLNIGRYEASGIDERLAWGVIAADLLRHISNALAESAEHDASQILNDIRVHMDNELGKPTSKIEGQFI